MSGAIATILVADFIMSLDNVLGVAGASEGNLGLLMFGLIFSMAILMFLGSLVADLINRLWWLAYVGSGVIAWTGAAMIFEDPFVQTRLSIDGLSRYLICGDDHDPDTRSRPLAAPPTRNGLNILAERSRTCNARCTLRGNCHQTRSTSMRVLAALLSERQLLHKVNRSAPKASRRSTRCFSAPSIREQSRESSPSSRAKNQILYYNAFGLRDVANRSQCRRIRSSGSLR